MARCICGANLKTKFITSTVFKGQRLYSLTKNIPKEQKKFVNLIEKERLIALNDSTDRVPPTI